jgi:hypothetical protein
MISPRSTTPLRRLTCQNLTVFSSASLDLSPSLNVFIGENGTGKTHLLQIASAVLTVGAEEGRKPNPPDPTKSFLQTRIAEKLIGVFRPKSLGRLARQRQGHERCNVALSFSDPALNIDFRFAANSKSEVTLTGVPSMWLKTSAAYFPTRELLTIYPNFVSVYESHFLEFEETWRDTCVLLGAPPSSWRPGEARPNALGAARKGDGWFHAYPVDGT